MLCLSKSLGTLAKESWEVAHSALGSQTDWQVLTFNKHKESIEHLKKYLFLQNSNQSLQQWLLVDSLMICPGRIFIQHSYLYYIIP